MVKIILELAVSYFDKVYTLKKESNFIPIPGMEIKFPESTHIGTINMTNNEDFFPEWDMEKKEVIVFLADVNTEDKKVLKQRLNGLKKDGWKITDVF